jgi:hypothetical protein
MVLYEIYREDGGNGITFVHMLYTVEWTCFYSVMKYSVESGEEDL